MFPRCWADKSGAMRTLRLMLAVSTLFAAGCAGPETSRSSPSDAHTSGTDVDLRAETRALAARITGGMTLGSLLQAAAVPAVEATAVIEAVRSVFDPRRVHVDQPYRLVQSLDGAVRRFEYEIDGDRFLRVSRSSDEPAWRADVLPIPKTHANAVVTGTIDRANPSLVAAVDAAGGTIDLAIALADIFGGDIDFNTELQTGDRFAVVVDKQFREANTFAGYGPIFAAEFENGGRRLQAVRFDASAGTAYFDEHGVSMRRFMLKSPLKFDPVITSAFSRARLHPILGETRAHLGVDYRAPTGAPVVAVANGVVVLAGVNGGAGRMVHLRHANGFETEYLHLSATTVRAGQRVQQGDVIGRVGATGLATGPHLDYRVRKNGVFINPVTALRNMPPADPVPAGEMDAFVAARDRALAPLSALVPREPAEGTTP
jgi:murein DD-endopeptidase MepM/ murein hydrolase activator NlpD